MRSNTGIFFRRCDVISALKFEEINFSLIGLFE